MRNNYGQACTFARFGVKTRRAIEHTCGLENVTLVDMTREEWHKWKKSLDSNYVIPSKEEDERQQWQEEEKRQADRRNAQLKEEQEAQRQREFAAYYNHT